MVKTYSELCSISSFEDRYEYLKTTAPVGISTFGSSRYLNQALYHSIEWKRLKDQIIIRDNGCDLAIPDRVIGGKIFIHHINPITVDEVLARSYSVFDPENLICVSFDTHQAIHYGDESLLFHNPIERSRNDTIPWK